MRRQRTNEDYEPTRAPSPHKPAYTPAPAKSRHQAPDFAEQREHYPDEDDRR